jgi:ABC-2 type transport system permease protein
MTTRPDVMPGSPLESQAVAPVSISPARRFYWSVRRELWENRWIYLAPLIAAGMLLLAFLIGQIALPHHRITNVVALAPAKQPAAIAEPYTIAAALIMMTAFIVGIFYTLDALYGERRDRSILFWKSLPVSDLTTVLAKLTVPMFILPLLAFAVTVVTQWLMFLLSSAILLGSGMSAGPLWTNSHFLHFSAMLLYHILTVHGLWYAPLYGWLLLASGWAPRAPFLWAFFPPFVIFGVEKIAFNTTYFLDLLKHRLMGPESPAAPGSSMMDVMSALTPARFFGTPGLWTGLAIAAVFIFLAVRLRRSRGPI